MKARVLEAIAALTADMAGWRRHLHRRPELSFQEHGTAAFVADVLRREGIAVREGLARLAPDAQGTGLIAVVRGAKGAPDRCIALRADMDALPVQEAPGSAHRSLNPGVMHACGHDAHTAMLLGAGIALHRLRREWGGQVMLVFQPGEEKEPGGASLLVREGALSDPVPQAIIGQHVTPELPTGRIGLRSGPFMAAADELYLTVKGRGGHASVRDRLADPVLIAAKLLPVLYDEAQKAAEGAPMVISFGRFIAQGATNIVPDTAAMEGTLRTFDEGLRARLHELLPRVAQELARSMGGDCAFRTVKGSPVVHNDPGLTDRLRAVAADLVGAGNTVEMDLRMGAEDFAHYTRVMPGCFLRLGTGNPAKPGTVSGLHTATFDIDEDALAIGAAMLALGALGELGQGPVSRG